jgi:hypothetical protein
MRIGAASLFLLATLAGNARAQARLLIGSVHDSTTGARSPAPRSRSRAQVSTRSPVIGAAFDSVCVTELESNSDESANRLRARRTAYPGKCGASFRDIWLEYRVGVLPNPSDKAVGLHSLFPLPQPIRHPRAFEFPHRARSPREGDRKTGIEQHQSFPILPLSHSQAGASESLQKAPRRTPRPGQGRESLCPFRAVSPRHREVRPAQRGSELPDGELAGIRIRNR